MALPNGRSFNELPNRLVHMAHVVHLARKGCNFESTKLYTFSITVLPVLKDPGLYKVKVIITANKVMVPYKAKQREQSGPNLIDL